MIRCKGFKNYYLENNFTLICFEAIFRYLLRKGIIWKQKYLKIGYKKYMIIFLIV